MRGRGKKWAAIFLTAIIFVCLHGFSAWGADSGEGVRIYDDPSGENTEEEWTSELERYDLGQIQEFLDSQKGMSGWDLSFRDLMEDLLAGNLEEALQKIGQALKESLFAQVRTNGSLMGQIMVLGLVGAVFANFSSVFASSQISETGFFVTYLLLFTCLAASFFTSISIAGEVVGQILEFMRALAPAYFLAVAFAGGSVSSLASYEFTLLMITAAQWLMFQFLLPLVKVYILLVLAGHIAREDLLSKLTELLKNVIRWSLKTLLGVLLGYHLIQGLVLPYVDSVKSGAVQKLIEVIPGIGQGAGAVTRMVLGSGVLIKNTIGAAGLVILLVLAAVPVIKLAVLMLLYQCAAAVMQPVCDKRVVSCISETAEGHKLLLGIVTGAVLLLVITIAVVCASSNVTYYTG